MLDFLIHRNTDGQIVRAIPYANMMQIVINSAFNYADERQEWRVEYTLQNMQGCSFYCSQADAERYLAEWRAWWEEKAKYQYLQKLPHLIINGVDYGTDWANH